MAVKTKHVSIAELVLKAGADPNLKLQVRLLVLSANCAASMHPLLVPTHTCACQCVPRGVPSTQSTMASTTKDMLKSASGGTALHEAAKLGHVQLVNTLLDAGADIEATNKVSAQLGRGLTQRPCTCLVD